MIVARSCLALTIVLVAANGPAWCGGRLDADEMKQYGGTYRSDCKNPESPRVTVLETSLVVLEREKRITGTLVPNGGGVDWFGRMAPEHFQRTLEASLPNGQHLYLLVYDDGKGPYLTIEADPKLAAEIGPRTLALKYRRCDAAGR
jgi:hypothetical protein